jgi:hypothetical protein
MKTSNADFVREISYGKRRGGIKLIKRFKDTINEIEVRSLDGKKRLTRIPVLVVDRLIQSLLELKVKMKDGSNYNSGLIRLAVVDGSGIESEIEDLNETGRGVVLGLARHLIETVEDMPGEEEEEEATSELVIVIADDDIVARTIYEIQQEIGITQERNRPHEGRRKVFFNVPKTLMEMVSNKLSNMPNVFSYNFNEDNEL